MADKSSIEISAARPAERAAALQLFHLGTTQINRMLDGSTGSPSDFDGLFVARRNGQLVGAAWGQCIEGRTAFCWPPCLVPGETTDTAHRLLAAVARYLDSASVELTQAILPAATGDDVELLVANEYRHLTDLDYMVASREILPTTPPQTTLRWQPLAGGRTDQLAGLIERTYRGSLDCPGIDGVRSIDAILAGYRATGVFRPEWWLRVWCGTEEVGCLILADYPEHNQSELIYLGVVPEMRGRGHGMVLTRYAQWLVRTAQRARLVLAVDDRNWPARRCYEATGFATWDRRSVFVRVRP